MHSDCELAAAPPGSAANITAQQPMVPSRRRNLILPPKSRRSAPLANPNRSPAARNQLLLVAGNGGKLRAGVRAAAERLTSRHAGAAGVCRALVARRVRGVTN